MDTALHWYPNNPLVHFGKSRISEKLGDTEQAAKHAERAAQLGFDFINAQQEIEFEL
jgi:hypothetical protein